MSSFIQTGQQWHFSSELELEETIWRHLPDLLNLIPLRRQYAIDGKVCDLLAVDSNNTLVIVELKNSEDRYIAQQLTRYYDALKNADALPFSANTTHPRLLAIAPSYHSDTLIDIRYSKLHIERLTFSLTATAADILLTLHDANNKPVSELHLPNTLSSTPPEIAIAEPPRKLLNWLSRSQPAEYEWALQMRSQLLSFDPRMREVVEPTRIIYGKGKSKPCCVLRKSGSAGYVHDTLAYFLWLPYPEHRTHVVRMMTGFDFKQAQIRGFMYCAHSFQIKDVWAFPKDTGLMKDLRWRQFKTYYQPLLNASGTIDSTDIVDLALRTWHKRL